MHCHLFLTIKCLVMLKFKFHQDNRRNAPMPGGWYARAIHESMTFDEFVEHMHVHHSVFSEATIKGVLTEMENCLRELLLEGKAVRLGTLGIFRIGIKTTGTLKLNEWNSRYNVKGARVNLYLGKRFRNLMADLKISETAKNNVGIEDDDVPEQNP